MVGDSWLKISYMTSLRQIDHEDGKTSYFDFRYFDWINLNHIVYMRVIDLKPKVDGGRVLVGVDKATMLGLSGNIAGFGSVIYSCFTPKDILGCQGDPFVAPAPTEGPKPAKPAKVRKPRRKLDA